MPRVTGNELVDHFLFVLDERIAGRVGDHPPESRRDMAAMRPLLRAKAISNPEFTAEVLGGFLAFLETGIGRDE